LSPQDELAYPRLHEYLALIRVCMAQGKLDDALQLLERLVLLAGAGEQMWVLIEMLVLQALALQMQDDLAGAMAAVERALAIAEPEGYIRTFVDEGKPMLVLLRQAAARGLYTDYVAQLLSAFPELVPTFAVRNARWMTSERLSEREAEVLRLMASGKSSPEIADVLVVGVSTVRTHIKNIYRKLDVHSREQAIERAKSWKLI
jgi:LuxR family maltose regulon positive regulatory protein